MQLNKHIRRHLVVLAYFMAAAVLGVYVAKAVHLWSVEQSQAMGDMSHDDGECAVCHFVLGGATEVEAIALPEPPQQISLNFTPATQALTTSFVRAYEGRGPPVWL